MRIKRVPWQRRPIALTPLIDVIFLLLLFFMLSSTFTRFSEIPLVNAGGGLGEGAAPLFLQLGPDTTVLNGEPVALAALPDAIDLRRDTADQVTLLITLNGEVSSQRLIDLLTELIAVTNLAVSVLE